MLVRRFILHLQIYSWLLNFESELPCKVTCSGFNFSTLLTSGLSFMHCCVVRQTLVGSEGLFTKHALKLLGLRIPIISFYRKFALQHQKKYATLYRKVSDLAELPDGLQFIMSTPAYNKWFYNFENISLFQITDCWKAPPLLNFQIW